MRRWRKRARLPTLKERYSIRLGRYIENPNLKPEQARNYEVGYQGQPRADASAETALFWNDVEDKIQSINVNGAASCSTANKCQMQNAGKARIKGIELGLKTPLGTQWEVGGNATWMDLKNISDCHLPAREGAVNGEVALDIGGGKTLTAIVTNTSIQSLGLKPGARACALVKASHIILAVSA